MENSRASTTSNNRIFIIPTHFASFFPHNLIFIYFLRLPSNISFRSSYNQLIQFFLFSSCLLVFAHVFELSIIKLIIGILIFIVFFIFNIILVVIFITSYLFWFLSSDTLSRSCTRKLIIIEVINIVRHSCRCWANKISFITSSASTITMSSLCLQGLLLFLFLLFFFGSKMLFGSFFHVFIDHVAEIHCGEV